MKSITPNAALEIPLRPLSLSPAQPAPLTSSGAPEAHGPPKKVFISSFPAPPASLPHFLPYLFDLCHSPSLCHAHAERRGLFKGLPDRDLQAKALMCLLFMLQHICGKETPTGSATAVLCS